LRGIWTKLWQFLILNFHMRFAFRKASLRKEALMLIQRFLQCKSHISVQY
jgi:hypothetical protein